MRRREREQLPITTDLDRLSQVFINLIANAHKYCDAPAPELKIVARAREGRITIDFIDNGLGISRDDQRVIFEKFSRLGDDRESGAGLGLSICREVMQRLGGTISYLPGQGGAAFRVALARAN